MTTLEASSIAGALVAVTHVIGALGRIAVGHLSDLVGSRVRPLRWVAIAAAVTMGLLGLTEPLAVAVVPLLVPPGPAVTRCYGR